MRRPSPGPDRPGAGTRAPGASWYPGRVPLERRLALLRPLLVVTALACLSLPVLTRVWPEAWMWEPRQPEYEQMIIGVYLTLGVFVLRAARDPLQHLSLIWFTAWSSLVHGGIMLVQALRDPAERANLMGDVPGLLLIGIGLLVLTPRAAHLERREP